MHAVNQAITLLMCMQGDCMHACMVTACMHAWPPNPDQLADVLDFNKHIASYMV